MSDEEAERRVTSPGRRATDEEAELIAREVRREVRTMRWRWLAVWLLTLALSSVSWAKSDIASDRTSQEAKRAAREGRLQCERARALGPGLVRDVEQRHVLVGAKLEVYKALIPKHC